MSGLARNLTVTILTTGAWFHRATMPLCKIGQYSINGTKGFSRCRKRNNWLKSCLAKRYRDQSHRVTSLFDKTGQELLRGPGSIRLCNNVSVPVCHIVKSSTCLPLSMSHRMRSAKLLATPQSPNFWKSTTSGQNCQEDMYHEHEPDVVGRQCSSESQSYAEPYCVQNQACVGLAVGPRAGGAGVGIAGPTR